MLKHSKLHNQTGENVKCKIQRGSDEINSVSGIILVGGILNRLSSMKSIDDIRLDNVQRGRMSHTDMIKSAVALLAMGKTQYTDIAPFRYDPFFRDALGLTAVPSESTFRQRIEQCSMAPELVWAIGSCNEELLSTVKDFGMEVTDYSRYNVLDIDVTPMDNSGSHKEGVSWTYKKFFGYAPITACLGTHGYMLDCEQRPGKQHSQKGAPEFLRRCLERTDRLGVDDLLVRMDSGHDCTENIELLMSDEMRKGRHTHFIIKRNLRKEPREQWLAMARRVGEKSSPRLGKDVYIGTVSHRHPDDRKDLAPIFITFEVIERTIDHDGQYLVLPEFEVQTWWTNLPDDAATVIQLYHNHATSEQFHSELKSDIGLERMPSGKFAANALILQFGMIAFNILRQIGQTMLEYKSLMPVKTSVKRLRLKTVMLDVIYIACKRVRHAGDTILKLGRNCPWLEVFRCLHLKFC